jgi:CubicO group peptidase (beta-lactamase class C family)
MRLHFFISRLAFLLLWGSIACCQTATRPTIANQIEAYLQPFVESGNFTGAVFVSRHREIILREAYGMANYELLVPNSPETRFHIASVSKPFTAAAILQLQEQGRLSITDHLSRFLPDFPNADKITLDHLLTHTSGIPNVNDLPDYDVFARTPHTLQELVAKFAALPLEFQPGADYHYSNSNYNLLALIIEKVTGQSYGDYIRQHILLPAGMVTSGHDGDASRLIPFVASGYQPSGIAVYEKAPYLDWSNKTGNGSVYSTLDDLSHFDRALNTDLILKPATREKYFVEGKGSRYGWFIRKRSGHRVMSANGRSPGFTAELDRYPDDDITIIVLSNSYATVSQDPIAAGIAAIVFGPQPDPPPDMRAVPVPQSTLSNYAGEYQFGPDYFVPNAKATVKAESGFLLLEVGTFRTPLVPTSPTEFLERNFFGHMIFSVKPGTRPESLTYKYAGREFTAKRVVEK